MVKQNKVFIRMRNDDYYLGNIRAVGGGMNLNWEHIHPIYSFETVIPTEIVDYYGIRLIIEYADNWEKPGQTVYDVWLTIRVLQEQSIVSKFSQVSFTS